MEVNQYNALENNRHLWYGRDEIFLLDLTNTIPIPTKYIKHKEILERCKNRLESSYDLGHISFKRYCYECKKNIDFVCSLSSRDCHITKPCKKHPFSILELYGINQKCKCEGCKENYFFNKSLSISVKRKFAKELLPKKRLGRKPRTKLEREILDELSGKNAVRQMNLAKEICKIGHSLRGKKQIRVRQPLQTLYFMGRTIYDWRDIEIAKDTICDNLNVKEIHAFQDYLETLPYIVFKHDKGLSVALDTRITPELKREGLGRDIVRLIQSERKKQQFNISDRIEIFYQGDKEFELVFEERGKLICEEVLSPNESKKGKPETESDFQHIMFGQNHIWFRKIDWNQ